MSNKKQDPNCIGRVIRIISDKTVVVSVSSRDVNKGDVLSIYQVSDELKDIDGHSLGPLIFDKETIVVTQTTASYSLCDKKDYVVRISRGTSSVSQFFSTLATSPLLESYEEKNPLNVDEKDIQPLEIELDPVIHIGDPVRLLFHSRT